MIALRLPSLFTLLPAAVLFLFVWCAYGVSYRVVEQKILYNGRLGVSLTSVVKAGNGDLLALFNSGKDAWPGSTACLMRSTDGGKTWSQPRTLIAPVRRGGAIHTNVGLTLLRNGDLILPFGDFKIRDESQGFPQPRHGGHELGTTNVLISRDHGHTWSDWIPASAGLPWSAPHGQLVEMPDGRILLPLWMSEKATGPKDFGKDAFAGYVISRDGGMTWTGFRKIGPFGEISLVLLADGRTLLGCLKQHPSRETHIIRSTDGGRTWTEPRKAGFQGKNAVLALSPSGIPLLLCSPVREGESRPGYIYYSLDQGETWREGVRLIEPIQPKYPMAYGVSAANLDGRRMFLTFFATDPRKPERGDSPWTTTTTYLGGNIVEELP